MGIFIGIVLGLSGLMRIPLYAFLYGRMFNHVCKQNKESKSIKVNQQQQPTLNKAELNLTIIGSLLALCDIALTLHGIDLAIRMRATDIEAERGRFYYFRGACIFDMYGWINGWLLLACCQQVRKQFRKRFGCRKTNQTTHKQKNYRNQQKETCQRPHYNTTIVITDHVGICGYDRSSNYDRSLGSCRFWFGKIVLPLSASAIEHLLATFKTNFRRKFNFFILTTFLDSQYNNSAFAYSTSMYSDRS